MGGVPPTTTATPISVGYSKAKAKLDALALAELRKADPDAELAPDLR